MELTSIKTIKDIQQKFGFTFKKGLGQNFLTSSAVIDEIVKAAECENGVIEIGPGFGVLTHALSKSSKKVVSIEIDQRLIEVLSYTLSDCDNVKIINADVLKADLNRIISDEFGNAKISVAANLPYYITTPIIIKLIEDKLPLNSIVVMVQKEVAQRICAKPDTKDYGAISVLCQYYCEPCIVTNVPASLFVPPPKVDSAVLKLKLRDKPPVSAIDEAMFFKCVKAAFSQRRKTLLNCLSSFFGMDKSELSAKMESIGITPSRRGETLTLQEFASLADMMCGMQK